MSSTQDKPADNVQSDVTQLQEDEEGARDDPAVLLVGPVRPPLQYSREQLLEIRSLPLSNRRPDIASEAYGMVCMGNKKRSETPSEEDRGGRGDAPVENHKMGPPGGGGSQSRRAADPRERVRKESEHGGGGAGIVLSPQRRSFTSGCQAPPVAPAPPAAALAAARLRPDSPLAAQPQHSKAEIVREQRRIGSGRILARDMSSAPWERGDDTSDYPAQPYRPPNAAPRDRGDDRYDRRSFGRDPYGSDMKRDRDVDRYDRRDRDDMRRGNRYNDRRRYDKDDEPEWFSGGPTSQLDTIELRGFDEPAPDTVRSSTRSLSRQTSANNSLSNGKDNSREKSTSSLDNNKNSSITSAGLDTSTVSLKSSTGGADTTQESPPPARSTPTSGVPVKGKEGIKEDKKHPSESSLNDDHEHDFNLDDFLKFDHIPGLLSNGNVEESTVQGSRFSQWFRRDSPQQTPAPAAPARPAPHTDNHERIINHLMDDLEPAISIPSSDTPHLFAPISPAGVNGEPPPPSLLQMLQRGSASQQQQQHQQQQQLGNGGSNKPMDSGAKIHSLEELEARMLGARPAPGGPHGAAPHVAAQPPRVPLHHHQGQAGQQAEDDISAFKRLLAQVSGGHAIPANNGPIGQAKPQPMSLLQMLNKSQQADQAAAAALEQQRHQQQHQQQQQQQQSAHIPQDLLYKLLQVQRQQQQQQHEMVNKMVGGRPYAASPELHTQREMLQRPEAQAIIHGLEHGKITVQHLMQQISNPGLQARHRELLLSILKLHHQQQQPLAAALGVPSPLPRTVSPAPPAPTHLLVAPPPQQQLRLSPLPPTALPARIPSPRELQVHTQCIMQGALIKKKLEEQRENYRRRQEIAAAASPTKQPPPIAFTPTSVLRKMTAEKEGDSPGSGVGTPGKVGAGQWSNQPHKMPQGRPIVKGNQSGMVGPPLIGGAYQQTPHGDFPNAATQYMNHHQQQHQQQFMSSLQQQQQQLAAAAARGAGKGGSAAPAQHFAAAAHLQHQAPPQQRQPQQQIHNMQSVVNARGNPMSASQGTSTLHQLLIHSHHRNMNDGGRVMGRGEGANAPALSPTSNQLARWFSPELLAQATAGKLPSVNMAANALSLEELERIQHSSAIVHN